MSDFGMECFRYIWLDLKNQEGVQVIKALVSAAGSLQLVRERVNAQLLSLLVVRHSHLKGWLLDAHLLHGGSS